ncbi:MAG: hypothetical protein Q9211_000152 [Gyalolechia sp. 1 TL-2023]
MARGRKSKHSHGQALSHHFVPSRNRDCVEEDYSGTPKRKRFSLRDEARNTERNHGWSSDQKLRHSQVYFVSDGGSTLEKSVVPQASAQETPQESKAPPTTHKVSLASMTIKDQDLYNADGQPLDRSSGRNTSAITSVHGSLDRKQNQGRPLNGVFFMDTVGSPTTVEKTLIPAMPGSLSPSRSDTSEEVIVFAGRKKAPQNSLQDQQLSGCKPSHSSDQQLPTDQEKLRKINSATARSPPTNLATPYGLRRPILSTESTSNPLYSKVDLEEQSTQDLTDLVELSCKGRRKQRQSKREARLRAEEADYIEHVHSAEELDEASRDVAQNEALRKDPLTDCKSEVNAGSNAEQNAKARSSAESPFRELNITQDYHDSDLGSFAESDSGHSIDDAQIAADVQEHTEEIEDGHDLLERRQVMMTDEQMARLLAKQEELGLSSSEVLLFDGNEARDDGEVLPSEDEDDAIFFRFSAATRTSRRAKHFNQYQSPGASSAILAADLSNPDPYGEFDVMDQARLSMEGIPKYRRSAPAFELSDVELDAHLSLAWEKDRSKKKIRKKEREELRAQGLVGLNQSDLKAKYPQGISSSEVKMELTEFMVSTRQSLALPPMANKERRIVHEMAHVLRLKSKSSGAGKARFPVLFKTGRTGEFNQSNLDSVLNSRRFFPRKDVKGQRKSALTRPSRRNAGKTAGVSYQDGEVVGAAAPEIGVENRGRAMLEKMGWSKGTALGALNNKGMLQPVIHTVKTTKAGLG